MQWSVDVWCGICWGKALGVGVWNGKRKPIMKYVCIIRYYCWLYVTGLVNH